jgi:predicted transcriptional regulator
MISAVVGEKNYPLRIPPQMYERVRALAEKHDRSANWVMVRLIEQALAQSDTWIEEALRR